MTPLACRCDERTTAGCEMGSGRCICKPQFAGENCDRCADRYYYYPQCIRKFCFFLSHTGYPVCLTQFNYLRKWSLALLLSFWIIDNREHFLSSDYYLMKLCVWLWELSVSRYCTHCLVKLNTPFDGWNHFHVSVCQSSPWRKNKTVFGQGVWLLYMYISMALILQGYTQKDVCTCYNIDQRTFHMPFPSKQIHADIRHTKRVSPSYLILIWLHTQESARM